MSRSSARAILISRTIVFTPNLRVQNIMTLDLVCGVTLSGEGNEVRIR